MLAWERQPEESARAYEAYTLYRDLGVQRSIAKVARELGKSKALLERWSVRHEWVSRVEALEVRDQMIAREAVEAHLHEQAADHGRREATLRDQALAIREQAMKQAGMILHWPLSEQRTAYETEDGAQVVYQFFPARWSKSTAVDLYHLAVGDAPQEPDEDLYEYDLSDFTEEEIEEFIRLEQKLRMAPRKPPEGR